LLILMDFSHDPASSVHRVEIHHMMAKMHTKGIHWI
jgi:hypothetical protein